MSALKQYYSHCATVEAELPPVVYITSEDVPFDEFNKGGRTVPALKKYAARLIVKGTHHLATEPEIKAHLAERDGRTKAILDAERNKKERTTMELPEDFKLLLQGLVEAAKINASSKPDEIVAELAKESRKNKVREN